MFKKLNQSLRKCIGLKQFCMMIGILSIILITGCCVKLTITNQWGSYIVYPEEMYQTLEKEADHMLTNELYESSYPFQKNFTNESTFLKISDPHDPQVYVQASNNNQEITYKRSTNLSATYILRELGPLFLFLVLLGYCLTILIFSSLFILYLLFSLTSKLITFIKKSTISS